MRITLLLTVLVCGCAVQPAKRPVIVSRQAQSTVAQAQAQAVAPGETVTLRWDVSEPTDCIVYSSPDKRFWSPAMRVTGTTAIVPVVPPQWFYVTSISDDGESLPSNVLGILGQQSPGIVVTGEHAPTPNGPWQAYGIPVYDGPADQNMMVFRLGIKSKSKWQTTSEP